VYSVVSKAGSLQGHLTAVLPDSADSLHSWKLVLVRDRESYEVILTACTQKRSASGDVVSMVALGGICKIRQIRQIFSSLSLNIKTLGTVLESQVCRFLYVLDGHNMPKQYRFPRDCNIS
jgi:hypothetical protein